MGSLVLLKSGIIAKLFSWKGGSHLTQASLLPQARVNAPDGPEGPMRSAGPSVQDVKLTPGELVYPQYG